MKKIGLLSLVAFATLMASTACADVVTLKSGKRVVGAVVQETLTEIQIQTDIGKVSYPLSKVDSVERNGLLPDEVLAETATKDMRFKAAIALLEKAKKQTTPDSESYKRIDAKIKALDDYIPQHMEQTARQQLEKSQNAYNAGKYEEAFAIIESAGEDLLKNSKQSENTHKLLAKIYVGRGKEAQNKQNYIMSVEQFKAATEADPELVEGWMLYGSALLRDKTQEAEGLKILENWLDKGKSNLAPAEQYRYNLLVGQKLKDRQQNIRAIHYFGECLKLVDSVASNGAESYDALSESLMRLSKQEWADVNTDYYLTLLDQVRGGSGDSFYLLRSILMGHNGDYAEAWQNLRMHLSQKARSERRSLIAEAWLRGNSGESDLVLQEFREYGIQTDKRDWEGQSILSWLYMLEGNNDDATTAAEVAITADPSQWGPAFALAEAAYAHSIIPEPKCLLSDNFFKEQTDLEVARKALREARRLSPGNPLNYILTARVMTAQKEFDDAKKYLDQADEYLKNIKLDNFEIKKLKQHVLLANADWNFKRGNRDEASKLLKQAAEILPKDQSPKSQELLIFKWNDIKEAYKSGLDTTSTLISEAQALGRGYLEKPGRDAVMIKKMLANLDLMASGEALPEALAQELGEQTQNQGSSATEGSIDLPIKTVGEFKAILLSLEIGKHAMSMNPATAKLAEAVDSQVPKIKEAAAKNSVTLSPDDEQKLVKYAGMLFPQGQDAKITPLQVQMILTTVEAVKPLAPAEAAKQIDEQLNMIKSQAGEAANAQLSGDDAKTLDEFKAFLSSSGSAAQTTSGTATASPVTPGAPAPNAAPAAPGGQPPLN